MVKGWGVVLYIQLYSTLHSTFAQVSILSIFYSTIKGERPFDMSYGLSFEADSHIALPKLPYIKNTS